MKTHKIILFLLLSVCTVFGFQIANDTLIAKSKLKLGSSNLTSSSVEEILIYNTTDTTVYRITSADFVTYFGIDTLSDTVAYYKDHTHLLNLNSTNYYHLTEVNHTDLTDGGNSTLHYHASDRDRANHTGTQSISTILYLQDSLNVRPTLETVRSEISDTASYYKDHTHLINLNSTNYYHLTQTNHTDLTDGGNTSLHIHDDRYFTETELTNETTDLYLDSIFANRGNFTILRTGTVTPISGTTVTLHGYYNYLDSVRVGDYLHVGDSIKIVNYITPTHRADVSAESGFTYTNGSLVFIANADSIWHSGDLSIDGDAIIDGTIYQTIATTGIGRQFFTIDGDSDIWDTLGVVGGGGAYNWRIGYLGSTSGLSGNEYRIESASGPYLQMDHDGNLEFFDGTTLLNVIDSIDSKQTAISANNYEVIYQNGSGVIEGTPLLTVQSDNNVYVDGAVIIDGTIYQTVATTGIGRQFLTTDGSSDIWDTLGQVGGGAYNWRVGYRGSTSGLEGNEYRIESASGPYLQMDHEGNLEFFDDTTLLNVIDSIDSKQTAISASNNQIIIQDGSGVIRGSDSITFTGTNVHTGMNIDADGTLQIDGNVSIQKTSFESWSSSHGILQIGLSSALMSHISVPNLYILDNVYYDGSWKRVATGAASIITAAGGSIYFRNDVSGTADAAYTPTETMRITDDNKVGIGTTVPDGKVHIHNNSAGSVSAPSSYDELTIENSGNTGVTLLTPDAYLSGYVLGSASDNDAAAVQYNHSGGIMIIGTSNSSVVSLRTNNTDAIYIQSDQDVGIKNTSPSYDVHIGTTSSSEDIDLAVTTGNSYTSSILAYGYSNGTGNLYAGKDSQNGGGIKYCGDLTPSPGYGFVADRTCFYRRFTNADTCVAYYDCNSNAWDFLGNVNMNSNNITGITELNGTMLDVDSIETDYLRVVGATWGDLQVNTNNGVDPFIISRTNTGTDQALFVEVHDRDIQFYYVEDEIEPDAGNIYWYICQNGVDSLLAFKLANNGYGEFNYGLVVGDPTDGWKGYGTINAEAVYDDGVLLSGYVLDKAYNDSANIETWIGKTKYRSHKPAQDFWINSTELLDIDQYYARVKEKKVLPAFEEIEADTAKPSVGHVLQRLWETVEIQAIQIDQLNERIKGLENNR